MRRRSLLQFLGVLPLFPLLPKRCEARVPIRIKTTVTFAPSGTGSGRLVFYVGGKKMKQGASVSWDGDPPSPAELTRRITAQLNEHLSKRVLVFSPAPQITYVHRV